MNLLQMFRRSTRAHHAPHDELEQQTPILSSLLVLGWVVEARDPYTGGHLWRVARYSQLLATRAGLASGEIARIAIGGFLHDLGKIGIPDAILRKPGRLTADEYEVVKTHPEVGARLLAGHPLRDLVVDAVRSHHERPDGQGYPHGVKESPIAARIVGICDAFDAMTSRRTYQMARSIPDALAIIEHGLGRQFDATFGEQFVVLGREGALEAVVGHSDDGIPLRTCLICGPTLVVRREHREGDFVACPSCRGRHRLDAGPQGLIATATGTEASAEELRPDADLDLVERFVHETARVALTA